MTPGRLRSKIIVARVSLIRQMLSDIGSLPLSSLEAFQADPRNVASAESYLRRALEALLDLGRHIGARGFGKAAAEYKQIAEVLRDAGVLDETASKILRKLAGYRNRMVHFYDEVSHRELWEICTNELKDIERVLDVLLNWINNNPNKIDAKL
ncbi:MAG TPA: DUF86 domain-containing protein [Acidobacteriota bacterium]